MAWEFQLLSLERRICLSGTSAPPVPVVGPLLGGVLAGVTLRLLGVQ